MSVHDFTVGKNCWGHSAVRTNREKQPDGTWSYCIFSPTRIRTGDEVLLTAASRLGALVYEVVGEVECRMDPGDQHFVNLRWTGEGILNGSTERTR